MDRNLIAAYRFHRARNATLFGTGNPTRARDALRLAREDMAAGVTRYAPDRGTYAKPPYGPVTPQSKAGEFYIADPSSVGLRHVGNVEADKPRGRIWSRRDSCGWYTDPDGDVFKDGTGLCWGVVYQLAGRKGESRFVAGYQMGGCDDGPMLDLRRVYVEPRDQPGYWTDSPRAMDAAREAARAADEMARIAAEEEREYNEAWRAGVEHSELGKTIAETRREILQALAERRQVAAESAPTLCAMLRRSIKAQLASIYKARAKRAELAENFDHMPGWRDA